MDDAAGEAFDKIARILELGFPGGPAIDREATSGSATAIDFPRGLTTTNDWATRPYDFSFSGLKTAVLYLLKNNPEISEVEKQHMAHEFENAVTEVLWKKTARALEETSAQTLVIGGGVSANTHIRRTFTAKVAEEHPHIALRIPSAALTTDNAIMIALAGFYRASRKEFVSDITANGNLSLVSK
jgi:N6-L-threonylcarbamoyladenine synthase